jgi:hypothetical protein
MSVSNNKGRAENPPGLSFKRMDAFFRQTVVPNFYYNMNDAAVYEFFVTFHRFRQEFPAEQKNHACFLLTIWKAW